MPIGLVEESHARPLTDCRESILDFWKNIDYKPHQAAKMLHLYPQK